jgi:hypothetical protein
MLHSKTPFQILHYQAKGKRSIGPPFKWWNEPLGPILVKRIMMMMFYFLPLLAKNSTAVLLMAHLLLQTSVTFCDNICQSDRMV